MSGIKIPDELRELYPFASNYMEQPGGRQHYLDEGSGHPIVMLHGNPTWSFFYRDIVKHFRATQRCLVPDHLGMGLSDRPEEWSYRLADHVANTDRLIEATIGDKPFDLIVHDWGGAIGMGLAVNRPNQVRRIVIMNTAAYRMNWIPKRIAMCRWGFVGEFLVRALNGFAWPATKMTTVKKLLPLIQKGYLLPYGNWRNRIGVARFVQDIPMELSHPSYSSLLAIEEGLAQLKDKPILIAWGRKDWCFDDRFLEEWMRRFPMAELASYPHAGHYLMEDDLTAVRARIEVFLKD